MSNKVRVYEYIRRCNVGVFNFSVVFALFMGIVVIFIRMKAQNFPVNENYITSIFHGY